MGNSLNLKPYLALLEAVYQVQLIDEFEEELHRRRRSLRIQQNRSRDRGYALREVQFLSNEEFHVMFLYRAG